MNQLVPASQPQPQAQPAVPDAHAAQSLLKQALEEATQRFVAEQRASDVLAKLPQFREIAEMVGKTPAVPSWITKSGNVEATTLAVILKGAELGIAPMASLQSIYMVEGKVQLSAELMRAVMLRAGFTIQRKVHTAERCVLVVTRPGQQPEEFEWTMADAQRARLTEKDNWKKYPRAMLFARCSADAGRALAADLLAACYTADEIEEVAEHAA